MAGLKLSAPVLLILILIVNPRTVDTKKPSIVFILADDLGWNDIGYHGSQFHTPTLDKLASDGVKLDSYYVQPICTPSRSQLLSGKYQIHTGLQHSVLGPQQASGLPLEVPTLADILEKAGYATHAVGKWHIGYFKNEYTPLYRGFQSFYGYLNGHIDYYNMTTESASKCKDHLGYDFYDGMKVDWDAKGKYTTYLYTKRAQDIISKHNKTQPLFLYLPFQNIHAPLEAPEKYIKPYEGVIKNYARRMKAAMASALDDGVKNITESLKNAGLWENTILVFSTDNGAPPDGGSNYPLRGWKWSLWEGGIKGVGFVHSPLLRADKRGVTINNQLLHISDWFPTLCGLAGASTKGLKLDGYDIWSVISQGQRSPRKEILHNIDPLQPLKGDRLYPNTYDNRVRSAIRVGHWKLLTGDVGQDGRGPHESQWNEVKLAHDLDLEGRTSSPYGYIWNLMTKNHQPKDDPKKNIWLFNIKDDPYEYKDVSDQHPDVVQQLLQRLQYYNSTAVEVWFPPSDPQACPELHDGAWVPWM